MKRFIAYKLTIFLITGSISLQSAFGQENADSLVKYMEIAYIRNPQVQQKFLEYKSALQKVPQVGSLPDPELSAGILLQKMELMEGYQIGEIRLMQMFPWFGVLSNARDEMSLMAKSKFESYREAKINLEYDVRSGWYELLKINRDIQILEKNIDILKTIERLAIVRFRSPVTSGSVPSSGGITPGGGLTENTSSSRTMQTMNGSSGINSSASAVQSSPPMTSVQMGSTSTGSGLADLYRIQIEIADLQNNIESLKNKMITVTARFNTYLNRTVGSPVYVPDTLKPVAFDLSMTAISDSMLADNPSTAMLKYERQSLDARYKMVRGMGYPMIGLGVNYSIVSRLPYEGIPNNGKDMIMPMITVTLPVYRKKYRAMREETDLSRTALIQGYEAASNSLQAELYEAVQLYQDAARRQKLYSGQSDLAEKTLNILLKSFSSSDAGLTDILRVRQQTLDYEFREVEAVADYNTAVAWIKRLESNEER